MGHLDAELFIEELWGSGQHGTESGRPTKDGWPVYRTQYHVASFRQDLRVHSYMCETNEDAAHGCREVDLTAGQLLRLAKLLKRFATDPTAMADYEDFTSSKLFGWNPGSEGHYADLESRMIGALALSKKIRKAAKYIKKRSKEMGNLIDRPWVYGVYRAQW